VTWAESSQAEGGSGACHAANVGIHAANSLLIYAIASRSPDCGSREIFDARLALTLLHHGVTEFATRNTPHFERYGFERMVNPIDC